MSAKDSWTPTGTALYRHYDAAGELLYVGITTDPIRRLTQHIARASWARDIANITIEWFLTRGSAVDAEELAIALERPRFNTAGRPPEPQIDPVIEMAKLEYYLATGRRLQPPREVEA